MGATLILLRHGQSDYNQKNLFTGWVDVGLSNQGILEAERAKELLINYHFDVVFTSVLKRAIDTADIVLGEKNTAPIFRNAALNERDYGALSGKNKDEARAHFGEEQIQIWRRSFTEKPPEGESLEDTCKRVTPYYEREIKPFIDQGKIVLITAHGNSLRALIKHLENLSDQEIVAIEIPTASPLIYRFDENKTVKKELK